MWGDAEAERSGLQTRSPYWEDSGDLAFGVTERVGVPHPVAVVEAMEVVGVVAVSEVGEGGDVPGGGGAPQARRDAAPAVGVFPGRLGAGLEFLDAQLGGVEDDVLAVVVLPVAVEDAPFCVEAVVEGG